MTGRRRRCFPEMLHALLCEGSEALHWSPCGSVVILADIPSLFDVLAPHMLTRNIQSVRRQLNNYAFVKLEGRRLQPHESRYFRPGFCREDPKSAAAMQRPAKHGDRDAAEDLVQLRRMLGQREARIRKLEKRIAQLEGQLAPAAEVAGLVDPVAKSAGELAPAEELAGVAAPALLAADAFDISLDFYDDAEDERHVTPPSSTLSLLLPSLPPLPEWNPHAWEEAY